jgi:hypothetical protein
MESLALIAEARVDEAMQQWGQQPLEGEGHPLDLDAYYAAPASMRAAYSFLRNASFAPPEVEAMKRVNALKQTLEGATGEAAATLRSELQAAEVELALGLERMRRTLRVDAGL